MTTATTGSPAAPQARLAGSALSTRILGWSAAAAIVASVLLMIAISAAGPSIVVPVLPRTWPVPPLWFRLHLSQVTATVAIYVAIVLGAAGVGCGLVAVRRGARPGPRLLMAGAVSAVATVAVLAVLPPAGSTDSLSYATYGRIAVLGHNPYVMTPVQLRRSDDPVGRQAPRNWQNDPSLYGPVATATEWVAAKLGGTSIAYIVFWLKLLYAAAFGAIALALDRLLRGESAARARAHLLWTVNPLMLWAVMAGAHVDGLAAALGLLGVLAARPTSPDGRLEPARALAAGVLVGAAAGVKAPLALLWIALAWSARRPASLRGASDGGMGRRAGPRWRAGDTVKTLAAAAAGAALMLVPGYLIAGRPALSDLLSRSSNLVTFDSFWRLFYAPFGYSSEPAGLEQIAIVACLAMAALLAWRLPPGPRGVPAIRPAMALTLAWLLMWPLQRPWYDAIAFCLLAVFPATRLDWVMLIRAVPAAMAVATGAGGGGRGHPAWLAQLASFIGNTLSPDVRLGAALAVALLCVTAAWGLSRPPPDVPLSRRGAAPPGVRRGGGGEERATREGGASERAPQAS